MVEFFDDNLDDIGLHVKSFLFCHNTRRSPSFLERQWSVLESSMGGITSGWHANENHGRIQGLAASGSTPCFIGAMRCWKADCIRLYGSTSRRSRRNHLRSIQPARFGQELFEIAINSTLRGRIQKTPWRVLFLQLLGPMIFFVFVLVLWMRVSGVLFCFFRIHPRNPTWNCMLFLRFANMNLWHGLKWILFPRKSCN